MANNKRTIRASEISAFLFCQRAWWFQRHKKKPINPEELAAGSQFHQAHNAVTRSSHFLQLVGWFFLIVGFLFFSFFLIRVFNLA